MKVNKTSWISPKVVLKDSPISGKGLFTTEPIQKDEVVIITGGEIFTKKQLEDPELVDLLVDQSICEVGEDIFVATYKKDAEREIHDNLNHSCDSNLGMKDELVLVARRDIEAGEEITADYALWAVDPRWTPTEKCQCDSKFCRGFIRAGDYELPEVQERYKEYFSPFIKKRLKRFI